MVLVILVIFTLPIRTALPSWMLYWFRLVSYPLLVYSLASLIFYKKAAALLHKYPFILFVDLSIAAGIIQIGGSWRSSYFGYTITTIILFTIFKGRMGAYISAFILTIASIIKDPSGGLPSLEVFFVDDWDMRMGAALIYITAGLILGYFSTLLEKLEKLSTVEIERARSITAMEERTRLVLELHDGAKQMVNAMLLKMNPLIKKTGLLQADIAGELRWLWRGMNYLQGELNQVMDTMKGKDTSVRSICDIMTIAKEEARIAGVMTGFSWKVLSEYQDIHIAKEGKNSLRRFFSEALMNAWKHSGENSGTIELQCTGKSAIVIIMDNGRGFTYTDFENIKTVGLNSLKHRAGELNGSLAVETAPNKGCKLILSIPLIKSSKELPYKL